MVEVLYQHLNAGTQAPMAGCVCVCVIELLCGGCSGWAHATCFLQCPELQVTSAFALDLSHECVLAYQRA